MSGKRDLNGKNGATITDTLKNIGIYYDSTSKDFWGGNNREGWIKIDKSDVKRWLAESGYSKTPKDGKSVSEIDSLLTAIQKNHDVDFAGSLAGFKTGVYDINGKRILVKDSPVFIDPKPGEWPLLKGIIHNMLGDEQEVYLYGWLKVAIQALSSGRPRVGQVLTLAGPKDCGKSLLQTLITDLLGGRSAKPHRYMSGETPFNGELFGAEHLMMEDEKSSYDNRARRNFGTKIKEITANVVQSCHKKHREALSLSPAWRLTNSVNDEPENLMILPPIDESIADKIIILKVKKHPMPMPSLSDDEREVFMAALRKELPHLVHFLLNWPIPKHLESQRYGITHFHHPDILDSLTSLAPETKLSELIDRRLFDSPAPGIWEGSSNELERKLTEDSSPVKREARLLLSFQNSCGTYLGRLQTDNKDRYQSEHTIKGNIWTICPP